MSEEQKPNFEALYNALRKGVFDAFAETEKIVERVKASNNPQAKWWRETLQELLARQKGKIGESMKSVGAPERDVKRVQPTKEEIHALAMAHVAEAVRKDREEKERETGKTQ